MVRTFGKLPSNIKDSRYIMNDDDREVGERVGRALAVEITMCRQAREDLVIAHIKKLLVS